MTKYFLLSVCILILVGCASRPKIVKIPCPPRPILQPVEVKDGKLDEENTRKTIENHEDTYEYIHRIEKLGCTR